MGPDKAGVQLDVSSGSGVSGDGGDEVCQVSGGRGGGVAGVQCCFPLHAPSIPPCICINSTFSFAC